MSRIDMYRFKLLTLAHLQDVERSCLRLQRLNRDTFWNYCRGKHKTLIKAWRVLFNPHNQGGGIS